MVLENNITLEKEPRQQTFFRVIDVFYKIVETLR